MVRKSPCPAAPVKGLTTLASGTTPAFGSPRKPHRAILGSVTLTAVDIQAHRFDAVIVAIADQQDPISIKTEPVRFVERGSHGWTGKTCVARSRTTRHRLQLAADGNAPDAMGLRIGKVDLPIRSDGQSKGRMDLRCAGTCSIR